MKNGIETFTTPDHGNASDGTASVVPIIGDGLGPFQFEWFDINDSRYVSLIYSTRRLSNSENSQDLAQKLLHTSRSVAIWTKMWMSIVRPTDIIFQLVRPTKMPGSHRVSDLLLSPRGCPAANALGKIVIQNSGVPCYLHGPRHADASPGEVAVQVLWFLFRPFFDFRHFRRWTSVRHMCVFSHSFTVSTSLLASISE